MVQHLSYHILGTNSAFFPEENNLRNKIYLAWNKLWSQVYGEADTNYVLNADEFTRQSIVTAIMYKDEVAAIHLYSFFHLSSLAEMRMKYFHFFSPEYMTKLKTQNVETVMSMEFLSVMPNFRKATVGVSLGSVVSQLGMQVFEKSQVDAIVAPARNDVGVNRIGYDLGFVCLEKATEQRGFICDLVVCFRGSQKRSESPDIRILADHLWASRTIHASAQSVFDQNTKVSQPKAA